VAHARFCEPRLNRFNQNVGIATRSPPFMADWWAQMPTIVQLADVAASGRAGR